GSRDRLCRDRKPAAALDLSPRVSYGQILSTREDLLPPAWTTELARLHSDVAPVPFDDLLPKVEQALSRSPFEAFAHVEREPYAAASIAQIHEASSTSSAISSLVVSLTMIVAHRTN